MSSYSYIMPTTKALPRSHSDARELARLEQDLLPQRSAERLAEIFKALSDPTRLRLISLLLENEACVHNLQDVLGMSQSAISHQLRHLRLLKLVRFRKEGRHVYYALDDEHVRKLFEQGLLHAQHRG
ncbi:MAG: winged helix-turn-helix transcriptional regulator [Anaerolineales bacterium]|nr:winged helix-turn-helix transcriptional regulator [Anaerolineales bacterium]MCW5888909.1 winged helix-turn-helix transcriptional regulator [Anaerolineales bacterium]